MEDFLTTKEAAQNSKFSQSAIARACARGAIRGAKRIAWRWFIPRAAFFEWVNDPVAHIPGKKGQNE